VRIFHGTKSPAIVETIGLTMSHTFMAGTPDMKSRDWQNCCSFLCLRLNLLALGVARGIILLRVYDILLLVLKTRVVVLVDEPCTLFYDIMIFLWSEIIPASWFYRIILFLSCRWWHLHINMI